MNIVRAGMSGFANLWSLLWQADYFQFPLYSALNIEYSKEYANESQFEDLSFVIEERLPVIGVLMSMRTFPDGRHELSGFGRPILYLESEASSDTQRGGAFKVAKAEFDRVLQQYPITSIIYQDFSSTLSALSQYLLLRGARATPYFTQVIDLSLSEADLYRRIRTSYKSLINWGKRNLSLRLLDSNTIQKEDMEKFRRLHFDAAGRETRSRRTWDLQYEMVRQGEAFVMLGFLEGSLVTGAFFSYSPKYCYYGVSASTRELFEKPLSHVVIWTAILHAKELDCRFFEMGEQLYPNQGNPLPTQKELGVSTFKRGFGGQTQIRLNVLWERQNEKR